MAYRSAPDTNARLEEVASTGDRVWGVESAAHPGWVNLVNGMWLPIHIGQHRVLGVDDEPIPSPPLQDRASLAQMRRDRVPADPVLKRPSSSAVTQSMLVRRNLSETCTECDGTGHLNDSWVGQHTLCGLCGGAGGKFKIGQLVVAMRKFNGIGKAKGKALRVQKGEEGRVNKVGENSKGERQIRVRFPLRKDEKDIWVKEKHFAKLKITEFVRPVSELSGFSLVE